ncbi:unnamed protein product [Orchesella dallaii]|uniref:Phospholipid scramblase n=1 Tax=Orchesella dallaii TaxID=48710 RepID=A0ABP1QUL1_9HEXA
MHTNIDFNDIAPPTMTGVPIDSRHGQVNVSVLNDIDSPEFADADTTSLSELIQNANIIREALRGIGFPEESELESESRLRVEEALRSVRLHEAIGFALKSKGCTCCPKITLIPKNAIDGDLPSQNAIPWKFKYTSTECGCFCCCMPISRSWQKMTMKLGDQDLLWFTYRPQLWTFCRKKPRTVEIFAPRRSESIGSVTYGKSFADKTIIIDRISRSIFLTAKMESAYGNVLKFPRIMIRDNLGMPIAVGQATAGISTNGATRYTDYGLMFSPLALNESASAKAVIAVAFAMWDITIREAENRTSWAWTLAFLFGGIVLFIYFFVTI